MTLGSGSFAGSSSSAIPFLKLLMPWATSPISSEILPRPNRSTNSTSTIRICDQLNPISDLQRGAQAPTPFCPARPVSAHYGSKALPPQAGPPALARRAQDAILGFEHEHGAGIDADPDLGAL